MAYKIIWSPQAELTFENVINYLSENWTIKQVENLLSRTNKLIGLISKNPFLFRGSEKQKIHEVLVTKHNLLLYQINETELKVELLAFFDTRQNPKKKYRLPYKRKK
jgi:plasmid stabilization system protein ParE